MNNLRWMVILLVCVVLAFVTGSELARRNTIKSFSKEAYLAGVENELGRYVIFRDIAKDITKGHIEDANCSAELEASASLDELKKCTANAACGNTLKDKINNVAPEVISGQPLAFNYIPSLAGIRNCRNNK